MNPLMLITALLPALQVACPIIGQLFPLLQSSIGALSNVNPAAHSNIVSFLQQALNELSVVGVIQLPKPLVVDGVFGGATFAAIKQLQAKLGFNVQEPLASLEMEALQALLAKL